MFRLAAFAGVRTRVFDNIIMLFIRYARGWQLIGDLRRVRVQRSGGGWAPQMMLHFMECQFCGFAGNGLAIFMCSLLTGGRRESGKSSVFTSPLLTFWRAVLLCVG